MGRGWRRHLLVGIPLLAIIALVLQTAAHANPAGHSMHQLPAAISASHCDHAAHEHRPGLTAGCAPDASGSSLTDCCQICLTCAVPVEPMASGPAAASDVFVAPRPDPHGRSPEGILRPPRLAAA
jgi:hypothetical protein